MRRLGAIALLLGNVAFVPPKREDRVEIVGVYEAVGRHPDGSTYAGKGTIRRLSNDRYEIIFDMPSGTFRASCLRVANILGCGWGAGNDHTVAVWREGAGIAGVWADDASMAVGRESSNLTTLDAFTGSGVTPDGLAYDASVTSTNYGAVQRVSWTRGPAQHLGWGIRVGSFLIAGFPANRTGAAFYRIGSNGTTLVGDWMDPLTPFAGLGTETMSR